MNDGIKERRQELIQRMNREAESRKGNVTKQLGAFSVALRVKEAASEPQAQEVRGGGQDCSMAL